MTLQSHGNAMTIHTACFWKDFTYYTHGHIRLLRLMMMMIMIMNCFCGMVDWRKTLSLLFLPGSLPAIITIANLQNHVNRIWNCAEPEFRPWWMMFYRSDNYYATAPKIIYFINIAHTTFRWNFLLCLHRWLERFERMLFRKC